MKKNKKGFSLIELLIVMAIIGIIAIGANKINFNKLADNQNNMMFSNDVYSNIEKVRNNSLLGKGIVNGTSMQYPNKWIIMIGTLGTNGTIVGLYDVGGTLKNYSDFKVNFIDTHSKINKLTCYNINKTNHQIINNIDIEIIGGSLSISGCTQPNNKILDIETKYKNFKKVIRINTVSGMIEKIDN